MLLISFHLLLAYKLKFIAYLRYIDTTLILILIELLIFTVFSEYIIGEFDVTTTVWIRIIVFCPATDPRGLGHRCINLFQCEFTLNVFFINIRNHVRGLNKGH